MYQFLETYFKPNDVSNWTLLLVAAVTAAILLIVLFGGIRYINKRYGSENED